jgi:predicted AlkP superfamily pyrophosphatase or phosphodiesterase
VHEAGKQTAYTDKHPAYDLVRGPSGKGLSVGYFPEIAATDSTSVDATIAYDQLHVDAWLDWIKGAITPPNSEIQDKLTGTPTLFGGNFQSVSVGQKVFGYQAKTLDFSTNLLKALDFVDASLGKIVDALKDKDIYEDTLIIVASKHGQAPIDPAKYAKISPDSVTAAMGVKVAFQTSDDIALIFLKNHADTDTAVANLNKQRQALAIADIIYGPQLIARGFGNPTKDTAVPDIIVVPVEGVIYTMSTAKIAEHGGFNEDDRHVACFISAQNLKKTKFPCRVSTKQIAPTILKALNLDVGKLQGAKAEGTQPLDGFTDN